VSSAGQIVHNVADPQPPRTFEEIYGLYSSRIARVVYRFTRNEEIARDLTQDIFIKVYEHMEEYRKESQLYTWIHRIAVNHVLNYLRAERRTKWYDLMDEKISSLIREETSATSRGMDQHSQTPHQAMERAEREKIVQDAIESLAPKYRVPFVLFRFEDMSYQEIAQSMNLSLSAVEARIHRAKKRLIRILEPMLEHI
jgi:RNA polymerase sigma-70 factor (ECF subfamily)